ncbi:hypothetical protein [uncultured Nonlabens sp.]|nr:hypothetical protein [uncultured Nonlabens sp.]
MPKLYNESFPEPVKPTGPRKETIHFLLSFSKALSVTKYKNMTFETFKN